MALNIGCYGEYTLSEFFHFIIIHDLFENGNVPYSEEYIAQYIAPFCVYVLNILISNKYILYNRRLFWNTPRNWRKSWWLFLMMVCPAVQNGLTLIALKVWPSSDTEKAFTVIISTWGTFSQRPFHLEEMMVMMMMMAMMIGEKK